MTSWHLPHLGLNSGYHSVDLFISPGVGVLVLVCVCVFVCACVYVVCVHTCVYVCVCARVGHVLKCRVVVVFAKEASILLDKWLATEQAVWRTWSTWPGGSSGFGVCAKERGWTGVGTPRFNTFLVPVNR